MASFKKNEAMVNDAQEQFLTVKIANQLFGIPVLNVRDVLKPQKITKIPLSKPNISGMMNLRGRIVTVLNMMNILSVQSPEISAKGMFVVVDFEEDYYCLLVDSVGQTLKLETSRFERNPVNLSSVWKEYSKGVFKLENELMLILDIPRIVKSA